MLALRFFLFVLPFQFALSPTREIDLPLARLLAVGICLGWFVFGLWAKNLRLRWDFQTLLFLSFWFFLALSIFFSDEMAWAWRKFFFLLSFLPLYFVFTDQLEREPRESKILVQAFVLGAFFSALVGCFQVIAQLFVPVETLFMWWTTFLLPFFLGDAFSAVVAAYPSLLANLSGETIMRASAFFPDPHMHAFYLGLAFPLAVFFAWNEKGVMWKWIAGVIVLADLLTFSRGAYLGLSLAFLGLAFAYFFSKRRVGVKTFFVLISCIFLFFFLPNPVTERFWSSFSQEDGSVAVRLSLYQEAVAHIREQPWIGAGLGNYPLVVKPSADRREPIYVHNLWLDLAVEIGVIGTLAFLIFIIRAVLLSYRHSFSKQKTLPLAIFCSLLIFLGHSLVEMPLFSVQVLPAFLFVLALGNRSYEHE
jgi:O-antigen ligase